MKLIRRSVLALALLVPLCALGVTPAGAAGGGGGGGSYGRASGDAEDRDLRKAKKAIAKEKWEKAIRYLQRAASREPRNADAQNLLGYAHRRLGKYDDAFAFYDKALSLDPEHKQALEYLGEAYLETDQMAEAEKLRDRLRRLCPLSCDELTQLDGAFERHAGAQARSG